MRLRTFWLVGLVGTLLVPEMSSRLGDPAGLAMAEAPSPKKAAHKAAPHPAQEGRRADGNRTHEEPRGHHGTIQLNFRHVDVLQMIQVMSELTGKNFLVDDKVRGTVTLIAPTPVTLDEAYQIFLAALAMQGFTVVPQGPIITIIPSRDAQARPLPTTTDISRPH